MEFNVHPPFHGAMSPRVTVPPDSNTWVFNNGRAVVVVQLLADDDTASANAVAGAADVDASKSSKDSSSVAVAIADASAATANPVVSSKRFKFIDRRPPTTTITTTAPDTAFSSSSSSSSSSGSGGGTFDGGGGGGSSIGASSTPTSTNAAERTRTGGGDAADVDPGVGRFFELAASINGRPLHLLRDTGGTDDEEPGSTREGGTGGAGCHLDACGNNAFKPDGNASVVVRQVCFDVELFLRQVLLERRLQASHIPTDGSSSSSSSRSSRSSSSASQSGSDGTLPRGGPEGRGGRSGSGDGAGGAGGAGASGGNRAEEQDEYREAEVYTIRQIDCSSTARSACTSSQSQPMPRHPVVQPPRSTTPLNATATTTPTIAPVVAPILAASAHTFTTPVTSVTSMSMMAAASVPAPIAPRPPASAGTTAPVTATPPPQYTPAALAWQLLDFDSQPIAMCKPPEEHVLLVLVRGKCESATTSTVRLVLYDCRCVKVKRFMYRSRKCMCARGH